MGILQSAEHQFLLAFNIKYLSLSLTTSEH